MLLLSASRRRRSLEAIPIGGIVTSCSGFASARIGQGGGIDFLDARPVDHHDRRQPRYPRRIAPRRQLDHAISPNQEEEVVARPLLVPTAASVSTL